MPGSKGHMTPRVSVVSMGVRWVTEAGIGLPNYIRGMALIDSRNDMSRYGVADHLGMLEGSRGGANGFYLGWKKKNCVH